MSQLVAAAGGNLKSTGQRVQLLFTVQTGQARVLCERQYVHSQPGAKYHRRNKSPIFHIDEHGFQKSGQPSHETFNFGCKIRTDKVIFCWV